MRFPYQKYPVSGIGAAYLATVYRPTILFRVIGPAGDWLPVGLVDTGADETLLPDRFLAPLGVRIHPSDHANILGIGGLGILVRYGPVDLELSRRGVSYRWSAKVAFYPGSRAILGHSGFLEHYTATFNGRRRYLTLTPNGPAPPPAFPA